MPASWFPPRLCSHTSLPVFTSALVLLLSCSWPWEGEVGIPAQPNPARTELCHRSPCDLEFLCPSPVSSPSVSLQKQVCNATYSTKHPIPALAFVLCVPAFPQSWCLSPCSQLSTSLQSITLGRRRWGQGRGELVMHALPSRLCSFFFASFLPALFLFTFFLTLFLQNTCDLLPPQVSESQKKGRNVRIWQVSNQLFYCITPSPSHLSPFFSFPFKFL